MRQRLLHITLLLIWTVGSAAAQSLSERIALASPGDVLHVEAGVYTEPTLLIDRPLTLLAAEGAVIRGAGNHELIVIGADSVTIRGFRFEHVERTFMEDRAAIRVAGRKNCRIQDNTFEDVFFGIYLAKADGCEIRGNTLRAELENETSGGNAIQSWYSRNLTVANNRVDGFRDGIYLEFTEDSRVAENISRNNLRYGLHFMFSDRCAYEDNLFEDNRAGVAVMYADGILMRGNEFRRAWGTSAYGLLLKEIRDGQLSGNRFEGNTTGVFMEASDRLHVTGNAFVDNGWALRIMGNAIENRFEANDFVGNTFDVSTNSRSAPSSFAGNYWDRYAGYDLDRDGTGDTFYRPVRLFSVLAERHEASLFLYRSILVDVLNAAEDLLPVLTPTDLTDDAPRMRPVSGVFSVANPPSQP
jgi:nitrous oxidase accessory protein